jgi:hypothetical protein
MKVNPMVFIPLPYFKALRLLVQAKLHGTKANVPNPLSHVIKTV